MPVAIAITHKEQLQKTVLVRGTLILSGNYSAGGDALDLTAATSPKGEAGVEAKSLPKHFRIWGQNGYSYAYIPGTTRANGKLKVNTTAATELPGAPTAYPAGITGDVVNFEASFPKGA